MPRNASHRKANAWTARIIPAILFGIIAYSSWVVTRRVCLDYLLNPPASADVPRRAGPAIAILVIYYLLLLPVLTCYTRLIQTIVQNPGYVPRGPQWRPKGPRQSPQRRHRSGRQRIRKLSEEKERASAASSGNNKHSPRHSEQSAASLTEDDTPRVEDYWLKEVFVCNYDGRPPFCSSCLNFKPDRAHHCSEVNRCVRKMDHFCPWVGGIVSETSIKFFIQLLFYSALFTTHTLVFMVYFYNERHRRSGFLDVNWILTIAFAAMFLLFSAGMFASTFQLAVINSTTVENLSRKTKVWYLAVHMPRPEEVMRRVANRGGAPLRTITYPRPPEEQQMLLQQGGSQPATTSTASSVMPADRPVRTFAILETPAGFNPWDCGALQNIREVMGNHLVDWFLPFRHPPSAEHNDDESMFRLGPQVERLKEEAGLVLPRHDERDRRGMQRKRRRRRKSQGASEEETSTARVDTARALARPRPAHIDPGESEEAIIR